MLLVPQQTSFGLQDYQSLIAFLDSQAEPKTLVFWSTREPQTGQMWCPDCVKMEASLIELTTKTPSKALDNLVYIYVGQRDEWRSPTNQFRTEPWNVERIPTVLAVAPKAQGALKDRISPLHSRLVEDDACNVEQLAKYLRNSA